MPKICSTWDEFRVRINNSIVYPPKRNTDLFLSNLYFGLKNDGVKDLCFPNSNIHFISLFKWYLVFASQSYFAINLSSAKFKNSPIFSSPFFSNDGRLKPELRSEPVGLRLRSVSFIRLLLKYGFINASVNFRSCKSCWRSFLKDIFSGSWLVCIDPNALSLQICSDSGRAVLLVPPEIFFFKSAVQKPGFESFLRQFENSGEHIEDFLGSTGRCIFNGYSRYWLKDLCESLEGLSIRGFGLKYVLIGRQCSNPYAAMLAHFFRRTGATVVTFDHGSGNAHHVQEPVHWVEYLNSDTFVTTNSFVAIERQRQFSRDYVFDLNPTEMIGKRAFTKRLFQTRKDTLASTNYNFFSGVRQSVEPVKANQHHKNDITSTIDLSKTKVLYLGTAFHGWRHRLRPINNDCEYFKWQMVLLRELSESSHSVHYRPHPEGATKGPGEQICGNNVQLLGGSFEKILLHDYDLIVFDFIFSSVMPQIFCAGVPLLFFNTGYPQLTDISLQIIRADVNYFEVDLEKNADLLSSDIAKSLRTINRDLNGSKMFEYYFNFNAE